MKVLTVDENVAPFALQPSNGSTSIPITPRPASGGSGNVEFAQVTLSIPNLGPNEFNNQNSVDTTGLFSTPVQPGDFLWCNCLYLIASGTSTFAAAIECTAQDTCAIAVVAFNSGSPAADMVVRIGRVAAP